MATVGELKTKISLDSAQFEQSMAGVNRQLKGLKQEQKAVTSSGTGFARGVDELRDKSDVLNRTLTLQKAKVEELKRQYEASKQATGENSKETQNANEAYQKAKSEMNKTENALKGITAEIERQTNPWQKLSRNMDETGKKMQEFGRGMTRIGRNMTTRVTLPIVGIGAAALKVGMDFEEGMSKVQAISGATGDEFKQLESQARELGAETRFSATEAASGMEFLAMAGFETNEILASMPGLLDLAAASGMDLGRTADIASNILSGFNYEAEEAGRVADVLAKGAASANTNVEQLGGAMQYVAPVANTLGLEIEEMVAAVGLMSDAGIQGQQAGRMLRQGFLRLADPTGKAADLIKDLGINVFDAEGNMKNMDGVIAELENGLEGMDAKTRAAALSTIFGSQSTAGWSAMLDRGSKEVDKFTKELEGAEGAASEMAGVMEDNAKGALREFRSAAEEIGIAFSAHMIPMFTDAIRYGTDLVRKFGELDEGTQKNIIKMGALAAAIGPVALVTGSVTTSIGGLLRVGSSLTKLLGATSGAGLIGRMGILGAATGPVGVATATIGALGIGVYQASKHMNKLHDVSTETADAMMDQYQANIPMIDSFDELRSKSELTNAEFSRYLDLLTALESESDASIIENIKQEMEYLQEKSGLSNEELDKMVKLNGDITEAIPEATAKVTEQGNRVADTTDKLKDYNQEIANMAKRELESQLQDSLANEQKIRAQIKDEQVELNRLTELEAGLRDLVKEKQDGNVNSYKEKISLELESTENAIREAQMQGEVSDELLNRKDNLERLLALSDMDLDKSRETLGEAIKLVDEQRDLIGAKEEELGKTDQIIAKMVEQQMIAAGISEEVAQQSVRESTVSDTLDEQLKSLESQKKKLQEQTPVSERNTKEYREGVNAIDKQIEKLEGAKGNITDLIVESGKYNTELSKDILKNVDVKTNPSISEFNRLLTTPLSRSVRIRPIQNNATPMMYAKGTNHHPGGPFIAGEEGFELGKLNNKWELLNAGLYDRPSGYQVFTHNESKRILRSLNNMPAYASGTNMGAETNRIVNGISKASYERMEGLLEKIADGVSAGKVIVMDSRVVGELTAEHVTNYQDYKQIEAQRGWG